MATKKRDPADLLPILRCPLCAADLKILATAKPGWSLPNVTLSSQSIECVRCGENFPITDDGIPIMWTPEIRRYLGGNRATNALAANIEVYDEISDHYLIHVRKTDQAKGRFMACVRSVENSIPDGWHVDWGCGPGHVLIWTKEWAAQRFLKQVGIDVSLQNLRNVLATTDAYAVLGDAVQMPFKDGIAALVTEASVLHHIDDWRASIAESSRIAAPSAAIILDNEPTKKYLDWSPLARFIFEARFIGYKILSYFMESKKPFRNIKLAKLNYYSAEVHNQPGRGFEPHLVQEAFEKAGRSVTIYFRMGDTLQSGSGQNAWQSRFLLWVSRKDQSDAEYGIMTMLARSLSPGDASIADRRRPPVSPAHRGL